MHLPREYGSNMRARGAEQMPWMTPRWLLFCLVFTLLIVLPVVVTEGVKEDNECDQLRSYNRSEISDGEKHDLQRC